MYGSKFVRWPSISMWKCLVLINLHRVPSHLVKTLFMGTRCFLATLKKIQEKQKVLNIWEWQSLIKFMSFAIVVCNWFSIACDIWTTMPHSCTQPIVIYNKTYVKNIYTIRFIFHMYMQLWYNCNEPFNFQHVGTILIFH